MKGKIQLEKEIEILKKKNPDILNWKKEDVIYARVLNEKLSQLKEFEKIFDKWFDLEKLDDEWSEIVNEDAEPTFEDWIKEEFKKIIQEGDVEE